MQNRYFQIIWRYIVYSINLKITLVRFEDIFHAFEDIFNSFEDIFNSFEDIFKC